MKNGFTLMELLAVIIILALLAVVATSSLGNVLKESKDSLSEIQINALKEAAAIWGVENSKKMPREGDCIYFTLGDLKEYGLLDSDIIDTKIDKKIPNKTIIKISSSKGSKGKEVLNYEINADDISSCGKAYGTICTPAKEDELTLGHVPSGDFEVGDEYICEVGNDIFYNALVMGEKKGEIELFISQDLGISDWVNESDFYAAGGTASEWNAIYDDYPETAGKYKYGPVTAIKYLNEKVKTWSNINYYDEYYTDCFEHYTIHLTGKVRLPYLINDYRLSAYLYDRHIADYADYPLDYYLNFAYMDTADQWFLENNFNEETFEFVSDFQDSYVIAGSYANMTYMTMNAVVKVDKDRFAS